ncbi:ABC transporter permease [Rosettibacter firmus]|uniref:ABC transporter permease n=1 Tax=Rosettibacter firmus TaxID=3111522 RepID=UPI00336C28FE
MKDLIYIELIKIYKKWRTYIGFIAIGIIIPIIQISLYANKDNYIKILTRGFQDSFIFIGNLFNGYLIAYLVLSSLFIHIPFLIVLVGGDILAGEATAGTYRMLLTRPISRFQIILSKYIAGIIYVISLILWLALLSLGISILFFGTGELIAFRGKLIIFASNDILWRFFYSYSYAILSMVTVFSLSFLFSSLVENAIGPIVASMAVIIILLVLSALPIEFFNRIQPYFFTTHMTQWDKFFNETIDFKEILNSAFILIIYSLGFFLLTTIIFLKKDILS